MTAGDTAVLVVASAGVLAVVVLSLALVAVTRTLRSLQATVELLRQDAAHRTWPATSAAGALAAGEEPGRARVRDRRRDPASLLARVAVANPYLDVSEPVIKALAFASGTTRAATRLRRGRQGTER